MTVVVLLGRALPIADLMIPQAHYLVAFYPLLNVCSVNRISSSMRTPATP